MKVAGVVVLYNPDEKVMDNIKSYINDLDKLYVVDNSDKKNLSLNFDDKKIEYISNGGNKGIAYALNVGAMRAYSEKFDWLLTMDQDSKFVDGHFKKMISYVKEYKSNNLISESLNFEFDKVGVISALQRTKVNEADELQGLNFPLVVMTSGNLINLNIYNEIGGFNEDYFIDCVDFDYCLKVKKNFYEVIQLYSVELEHNLGDIKEINFFGKHLHVTNHNYIRRYYISRNRHYLYDEYKDIFKEYCDAELGLNKREMVKIILFEKNKLRKIRSIYRGYRDYKKGVIGKYSYKN